jgi:DNA-binding GntR family transcriptional regulator
MTMKTSVKSRKTAASTCFDALRTEILAGVRPPGQRLKIDQLCQVYESSINPVREALNRLSAEGFVLQEDQRGFSVAPISLTEWRDTVAARCLFESAAFKEAIRCRSALWEENIVIALHWLSRTPRFLNEEQQSANPDWEPRHHAFHNALLANCGSVSALAICENLRERSDRYRHIASIAPQARKTYGDEHKAIAEAAISGEAELAVTSLIDHYHRTLQVVEAYFESAHAKLPRT